MVGSYVEVGDEINQHGDLPLSSQFLVMVQQFIWPFRPKRRGSPQMTPLLLSLCFYLP